MNSKDIYKKLDCAVCGKPASGFHYGATTCEACKVFFRRTVGKNLPSSPLCTGSCVPIAHPETGRMTFTCPLCRLNKCLQAGMKRHDGKRGRYSYQMKSECIIKARQDAHAKGISSSPTTGMTCPKIPTKVQNCNPSCAETNDELCGGMDNSSSFHNNELELIENQVPMATDELQILELNEIEQDLKNLSSNTQDPLRPLRKERDLKENIRDPLQEAWDRLESENKETPYDDSFFDSLESSGGFTQNSNHYSETEQLGTKTEGPFHRWRFFAPPVSVGNLDLGTRFTAAAQSSHCEPHPQYSPGAQTSRTKIGEEHPGNVYTTSYTDATFERNRNYKNTETTEELDAQITKALQKVDLRFSQFVMQRQRPGSEGSDSVVESRGRSSETGPGCETGDVGNDSVEFWTSP